MRKSNNSSGAWAEVHGTLGDVTKGDPGKSAYEIAVEHGFEGTEEEWLAYVQANADRAVSAENAAVAAKEAAQYASDEAQGFSESASTSAGVAHTEAEAAAESAARAESAATSAVESRDGAAMSAVDAADSATAAAASATEAASQALLATGRADEARQSQIDAHVSEVHCEEMWLDFQRFPDLAKQYAEEAALSAQNAADSETATAASAQAAAQSATAAAGSATASAGSASESASSAEDSADSASEAAASATAAAGSATAAAGSATQAEAAVTRAVSEAVTAAQTAVQSQLDGKLDVDGKAVDSAHADDADTVNNHTVLSDVPANAVFTDTTYQQMTDQELDDGISTQGRVVAANTIATFILNVIADVINSAPAALDTLEELAAAINDDPDFHVTVMNEIGKKLDKAGGVVTGDLTVNGTFTADVTGNVSGNAATATKATGDKDGNDIAETYLPLAGGTMTGNLVTKNRLTIKDPNKDWANAPSPSSSTLVAINFCDKNGTAVGYVETYDTANSVKHGIRLAVPSAATSPSYERLGLEYDGTSYYAYAPTPTVSDNSKKIATTAWVRTATGETSLNAATASKAAQLTTARTIDGVSFDGTGNITHYGVCSTAAATVEKAVDCPGFVLATGARITVKFTVTNTAANPTFNVNSTGAKAIYYRNAAVPASYLSVNNTYEFVYNGTQYELVGNVDTNNVTAQNISTANNTYPILLGNTANATANIGNKAALFGKGVKVNPSTSTVVATTFKGALSGNAATATGLNSWKPSTVYAVGDIAYVDALETTTNKKLVCVEAGTSGTTLALASTAEGALITDGTVTWQIDSFADGDYSAEHGNGIYRGADITAYFDSGLMSTNIAAGNFVGVHIGDYITKTINLPAITYTDKAGVEQTQNAQTFANAKFYVAGIDSHLKAGDRQTTANHIVLISANALQRNVGMNPTDDTTGGYIGSDMWRVHMPNWNAAIKAAFGESHVVKYREWLSNAINATVPSGAGCGWSGAATGWAWTDVEVNIPNEQMIYGGRTLGSGHDCGSFPVQLPLFAHKQYIGCDDRSWFWLRAVALESGFSLASGLGFANAIGAALAATGGGIRPFFLLK